MTTNELQGLIEPHLERIEKILPKDYKLTLVCRYTGAEFNDADVILTLDELPKVSAAISRFSAP